MSNLPFVMRLALQHTSGRRLPCGAATQSDDNNRHTCSAVAACFHLSAVLLAALLTVAGECQRQALQLAARCKHQSKVNRSAKLFALTRLQRHQLLQCKLPAAFAIQLGAVLAAHTAVKELQPHGRQCLLQSRSARQTVK